MGKQRIEKYVKVGMKWESLAGRRVKKSNTKAFAKGAKNIIKIEKMRNIKNFD